MNKREFHANSGPLNSSTGALFSTQYDFKGGYKLRNFGFADNREILIDELGRIYFIPDSGDLYYLGGKFYEGLYNLIFRTGNSFIVEEDGELFVESEVGISPGNMNIRDTE